jgi:hypothetical protein
MILLWTSVWANIAPVTAKQPGCRSRVRGLHFSPKARIARGIHNFWEEHSPTIRANVTKASLAVQNTDVITTNGSLACIAFPWCLAIGCRLLFDTDEAMSALAVNVESHGRILL